MNTKKKKTNLFIINSSDEVASSANQEDSINSSNPLTRPTTGTSLDDSSPATSDDESLGDMETWSSVTAEMIQQLTEIEKKRQEIINGMKTNYFFIRCAPSTNT